MYPHIQIPHRLPALLAAALLSLAIALAASPARAQAAPLPEVLTLDEAALLLRLPAASVAQLAQSGELPGRALLGQWRFNRATLLQWLGGHPGPAATPLPATELAALAGRGNGGATSTATPTAPRYAVVLETLPMAQKDQFKPIPAALQALEVVTSATLLDGLPALQVAVGYFTTRAEAEAARNAVLARFPGARVIDLAELSINLAAPPTKPAVAAASATAASATASAPRPTAAPPTTIGEKSTVKSADRIALRDQAVLLPGGGTTVDFGLAFGRAERNNFPALRVEQTTVTATLAARYGIADDLQFTARVPAVHRRLASLVDPSLGPSASESVQYVGDISVSLLGVAAQERVGRPNVIWSLDAVLPSGPGDAGLGGGIVFSKSYDPLVLFGGLNYLRGLRVDAAQSKRSLARNNFGFSMGWAYAINDTVALSTVLLGAYRNTAVVGSGIKPTRESFQLQLGMTWQLGSGLYLEPTAAFSLGGAAPDFSLSVNLPFSF